MWNSEDPAVRARRRGRSITEQLAALVAKADRGGYWLDYRAALRGEIAEASNHDGHDYSALVAARAQELPTPEEVVRYVWTNQIDPAGGWTDEKGVAR